MHEQNAALPRPEKEVKGFEKVKLAAVEQKIISIKLDADAFKYYDDIKNEWVMDKASFDILVGSASDNIKLRNTIKL